MIGSPPPEGFGLPPAEAMALVAQKEADIKAGKVVVEVNDNEPQSS